MEITFTSFKVIIYLSQDAKNTWLLAILEIDFCSFVNTGWNFRKEAQAIASWTIPSCHTKAANTALMHSARDGDIASLKGSFISSFASWVAEATLFVDPVLFLGRTGEAALLDLNWRPLSLRAAFGDNLKYTLLL